MENEARKVRKKRRKERKKAIEEEIGRRYAWVDG